MLKVYHSLQDVDLSGDKLYAPPPLGPEGVLHGSFENGLRYYVRQCKKPSERVAIALVVKIGSIVEEDHEQGVAHIVEHLAFNATEDYSSHQIVKFLESIGAEFGACQNAMTSMDDTTYQLVLPSDKWETVDQALAVLAQFAFKIRCAPQDLEKERGAVLEEWRMNRDANGRTQEAQWRLIMQGSQYADRLPIGTEAVIRGVPADVVKAFYERWYRPEHMAVVVVGDFKSNEQVVEALRHHLGSGGSRDPSPCPPIPSYNFQPHEEPRVKVFVDKEMQNASVVCSFKHKRRPSSTPADILEDLKDSLFHQVLGGRLFKLSRSPDPPFVGAGTSGENITATTSTYAISAMCYEGSTLRALESVLTEMARVRLHGFSVREIERAKMDLMAEIESVYTERDQGYCWDYRDEYTRNFLFDELVTGQEYEARLSKTLLPRVSAEDVASRAALYHPSCSCVIKTVEHRSAHSEEQLRAVLQAVLEAEQQGSIGPWEQDTTPEHLMTEEPFPGSITSQRVLPKLQCTEMVLSNGMRVTWKATDFMDDEVLISGFAFGGLTEVPRSNFCSCQLSETLAQTLGPYGYKPEVLGDILAGKRVEFSFGEGAYYRTLGGSASPVDLETALQIIYLLFTTEVKVVEEELRSVWRMMRQNILAQIRNPTFHYSNRVLQVNYQGCYYFEPMTLKRFNSVDIHRACRHHNESYADPAQFTLVLTGKLDPESLLPLINKYLASIPKRTGRPTVLPREVVPLPFSFPERPMVEDVAVPMVEPQSNVCITFPVTLPKATARQELLWMRVCCRVLESKLLQRMRFQFGEIYSVSVGVNFGCEAPSNTGDPRGDVAINFSCGPDKRKRLLELVLDEVAFMQTELLAAEEVDTARTLERRALETSEQENGHWHDLMTSGYQSKTFQQLGDLDLLYTRVLENREKVLAELSPETLRDAMCRVFPQPPRTRYTAIMMVPRLPLMQRTLMAASSLVASPTTRWVLISTAAAVLTLLCYRALRPRR